MNTHTALPAGKDIFASSGRDWRLPLVLLLTTVLAVYFWTGSRYPALSEKAMMGADTPLSGLSFDIAIELAPGAAFLPTIWAHTVNWLFTNMKGMAFGVLFGAMALTLLSLLQRRSFKNGFANSAMGAVIGAPLGVCVNCAVPIAMGLHAGRLRLETTLSAMLASPTLNVIVVTISFALLPLHVAAVKLFASLMLVLVGVPLICRFVLKAETEATRDAHVTSTVEQKLGGVSGWLMRKLVPPQFEAGTYGPWETVQWFARTYSRNLAYIALITVPMMFLAALLGALFVELFNANALSGLLPRGSTAMFLLGLVLVALLFSFAPAPIALDVILTAVILGLGVPAFYGAAIVVALGSFSVYAFIVLWRVISLRTAVALWFLVMAASICSGLLAHRVGPAAEAYSLGKDRDLLAQSPIVWPEVEDAEPAIPLAELRPRIAAQAITPQAVAFDQDGEPVRGITALPLLRSEQDSAVSGPVFDRVLGREIGIGLQQPLHALASSAIHFFEGGIAAGDVHGDGWPDLALRKSALDGGVALYANIGGRFMRQAAELGPVDDVPARAVGFADIDGDAALDMVVTTVGAGSYLFWNRDGGFDFAESVKLPGDDRSVVQSVAFADFDGDGSVDIALGAAGISTSSAGFGRMEVKPQENSVLFNRGDGTFTRVIPDLFGGQTLTLLASDFDRDGQFDLLAGNDVANTDTFTKFGADRKASVLREGAVPFPYRLQTSMSYDEGDYNNDLIPDYYGGQISTVQQRGANDNVKRLVTERCKQLTADAGEPAESADRALQACANRFLALQTVSTGYSEGLGTTCASTRDVTIRGQCALSNLLIHYRRARSVAPDPQLHAQCRRDIGKTAFVGPLCDALLLEGTPFPDSDEIADILGPAINSGNVMMAGQEDGGFADKADALGVKMPGWTWDAQFKDLDQDGWQDLFVMTGYWANAGADTSNVFYRNRRGTFVDATAAFGLSDMLPSYSAVRFDFDRDGDIDIVRSLSGPNVIAHRNKRPAGKGLLVHLRQPGGNVMAIGARVTVCTGGETVVRPGKCQARPIKASGGFQSFDPIAAHFGLGASSVSLIAVDWPDGKLSLLQPAGMVDGEIIVSR